MHGAACGRASALRGRAKVFGGEWVVRSAGLTHFRRCRSRVRVLLYIRPPRHRREIAAMGRKGAPAKAHRPRRLLHPPRPRLHFPRIPFGLPPNDVRPCRAVVRTSAPAFTLPPHGLRRRPRRLWPSAAAVIHNGLSTEELSTSLLAALCKTFSPSRLRTRIYIIYRSPVGCSRECPRRCGEEVAPLWPRVPRRCAQGGGGRRQRRPPPRAATRTFPAYGRITVRRVGEDEGKGGRPLAQCPAPARLRPSPCPPTAESLCAKTEVHKVIPAPARAFFPRQLVYGRAPAR